MSDFCKATLEINFRLNFFSKKYFLDQTTKVSYSKPKASKAERDSYVNICAEKKRKKKENFF